MRTRFTTLVIFMLASCTPRFIPTPEPTQGDTPTMPPNPSTLDVPELHRLIDKAKKDLAQHLSISVDQINGVEAKPVIWSNSSLGCPQPRMMYAEVLTPGYLILLNANGQNYEYMQGRCIYSRSCDRTIRIVSTTPTNRCHADHKYR